MTHKVFQKCRQKYSCDNDVYISCIETYNRDYFYPYKDSIEWGENSIKFKYPRFHGKIEDLEVTIYSIEIMYNHIKQISMYKHGFYTHRRCKKNIY